MTAELQKIIDEQRAQIESYEKKLKDVVHAYKSIQNEKKALEVALETLGASSNNGDAEAASAERASDEEAVSPIDGLKQALLTLTVENKRKELAYQSDKKSLLAKNEKLQAVIDNMQLSAGNNKELAKHKEQLRRIEDERERQIADHGAVLASVQKRYAEEAAKVQKQEKSIADLYKQIHTKDQQLQASAATAAQFEKLQDEMLRYKKQAEQTPRESLLLKQIAELKRVNQEDLKVEREKRTQNKSNESSLETRIHELENRLTELSRRNAAFEHERFQLQTTVEELQKKLEASLQERPTHAATATADEEPAEQQTKSDKLQFVRLYCKLKQTRNFDLYGALGLERPTTSLEAKARDTVSPTPIANGECDNCETMSTDLIYFKSVISHLQKQLRLVEENQSTNRNAHDKTIGLLRDRITELENAHQKQFAELTAESKQRVMELEEEMRKQRERMQQLLIEKDHEINGVRSSLVALRHSGGADPADPQPPRTPDATAAAGLVRQRNSAESVRSVLAASFDEKTMLSAKSNAHRTFSNHHGDTRNVFYEQQLSKYENEIAELRNMIRLCEMKAGDMEQAALTKDMQYLEIIETLKEELRVLECKLTLQNNSANIEYLRNIFVQFLAAQNAKSCRYMLKAIAGVLKLTSAEAKRIDLWTPKS